MLGNGAMFLGDRGHRLNPVDTRPDRPGPAQATWQRARVSSSPVARATNGRRRAKRKRRTTQRSRGEATRAQRRGGQAGGRGSAHGAQASLPAPAVRAPRHAASRRVTPVHPRTRDRAQLRGTRGRAPDAQRGRVEEDELHRDGRGDGHTGRGGARRRDPAAQRSVQPDGVALAATARDVLRAHHARAPGAPARAAGAPRSHRLLRSRKDRRRGQLCQGQARHPRTHQRQGRRQDHRKEERTSAVPPRRPAAKSERALWGEGTRPARPCTRICAHSRHRVEGAVRTPLPTPTRGHSSRQPR